MGIPEFWLQEQFATIRQVNGVTAVEYHFSSGSDAKKALTIMQNYVEKWLRATRKPPLYPELLVQECEKRGIRILHVQAGRL